MDLWLGETPWLALDGQFLGSAEIRALHLDASFRTFVQGDLSVGEYCRRMKTMTDSLGELGWPVEDRILVLNVPRGLSDRYGHLRTWISRQRPFPTFLEVRDDLVMEELTQGTSLSTTGSSIALAATTPRSSAPPPSSPSSLLGPPPPGPSGGGGGGGGWAPSPRRAGPRGWDRPWDYLDTTTACGHSPGCPLAVLRPPVVGAHLHVALPGLWRGGGVTLRTARRRCSPARRGLHHLRPRQGLGELRGLHHRRPPPRPSSPVPSGLPPRLRRPGRSVGTRLPWPAPSAPWG
ncbi:hypothetical protein ACQ4PT_018812 [Festuca glaucescens]